MGGGGGGGAGRENEVEAALHLYCHMVEASLYNFKNRKTKKEFLLDCKEEPSTSNCAGR